MNEAANKQPPFAEFLGLKVTHVSPERVTGELVARDDLNNRFGIMHGGALMALADNLGGTATTANLSLASPPPRSKARRTSSPPFRSATSLRPNARHCIAAARPW